MKLEQLERATIIYNDIKELDKEIIAIDKIAMLVANGEIKSTLELKIEDIEKQNEDSQKISIDDDGSIVRNDYDSMYSRMLHSLAMPNFKKGYSEPKKENEHILKNSLSENTTLQILGILLGEKQYKRKILLDRLHKFGVLIFK